MKKVNPVEDALEREIQDLLAPYPDPMGRTDFRKACRIGTRTSIYLLQIGLVPCENTGKQTRCYKIAKADVAAYLRRRLAEPAYYTPPSGWYKNYPNHKPPAFSLNGALLLTDATRQRVRRWYENLLARIPQMVIGHHRVIAGFLNAEYRHVGYLLPSVLKSVRFGGFALLYRRPASHEGKDMGGFVCASHRRKNKGFPTLKRTLNLGIEKGRLLKNSRPKGGLIQVVCYPTSPETVDITGFFEKFCIAIRTKSSI